MMKPITVNISTLLMCLIVLTSDVIAKPSPTVEYSKDAGTKNTPSNIRKSRGDYANLLCRLASKFTSDAVVFGHNFKTRRRIQIENRMPHPDIFKVMDNRRRDIMECCQNESVGSRLGCLADRRRWRIDYLCAEEPPLPIPFTDANKAAMEDRITRCRYWLGESRFRCFKLTSDQIAVSPGNGYSVDESDPLNDIWDYPVNISDTDKILMVRTSNTTRFQKRRDLNQNNRNSKKAVVNGNQTCTCTCAGLVKGNEHSSLPRDPNVKNDNSRKPQTNSSNSISQRKRKLFVKDAVKKKHVHPAALISQYGRRERKNQTDPRKHIPTTIPAQKDQEGHDDVKVLLSVLSTTTAPRPRIQPRPTLKPGHGLTIGKRAGAVPSSGTKKKKLVSKSNQDRPRSKILGIQIDPPPSNTNSQIPIQKISGSEKDEIVRESSTQNAPSFNKKAGYKRPGRIRQKRLKNRKRGNSRKTSINRRKLYADEPRPKIQAKLTPEKVTTCKYTLLTIKDTDRTTPNPDLTFPGSNRTIPASDLTTPDWKRKESGSDHHA